LDYSQNFSLKLPLVSAAVALGHSHQLGFRLTFKGVPLDANVATDNVCLFWNDLD
jgi:hypothetical protein